MTFEQEITRTVHNLIRERLDNIVTEETEKAIKRVRERMHGVIAEILLSTSQYYDMQYQQNHLVITVKPLEEKL